LDASKHANLFLTALLDLTALTLALATARKTEKQSRCRFALAQKFTRLLIPCYTQCTSI
jgi:hypothetical protein